MHYLSMYYKSMLALMQICCCGATAVGFDAILSISGSAHCKQIKKKQCLFAVSQHTANKPNGLCREPAHGKEATRRPPVCLGVRMRSLEKALP
jgi:hypothetical protein